MPALQSFHRGRALHQERVLPGSSGYHHPVWLLPCSAAERNQVGQSQASSQMESKYRTTFGPGEILHLGPIEDFGLFPGVEGARGGG